MSKKGVLGKGLDALITADDSTHKVDNKGSSLMISIHKIVPNPFQPRKQFSEQYIRELSESISANGVIQPIIVRTSKNGYEIIAGERRWRAAQMAGVKEVPAIVREVNDEKSLELALIENLQRENLNPVEEAHGYEMLIDKYKLTHEEIAKQIGKDRTTITNSLRLLKLTQRALDALTSGTITGGHARALLSLEEDAKINQVLDKIISSGLSVRSTEVLIKKLLGSGTKSTSPEPDQEDLNIKFYTNQLKSALSTNVRIVNKKGKGKIEIDYNSSDDFERIVKKLVQ